MIYDVAPIMIALWISVIVLRAVVIVPRSWAVVIVPGGREVSVHRGRAVVIHRG